MLHNILLVQVYINMSFNIFLISLCFKIFVLLSKGRFHHACQIFHFAIPLSCAFIRIPICNPLLLFLFCLASLGYLLCPCFCTFGGHILVWNACTLCLAMRSQSHRRLIYRCCCLHYFSWIAFGFSVKNINYVLIFIIDRCHKLLLWLHYITLAVQRLSAMFN